MWLFKKYVSRIQQDFYERQKSEIFFKEIVELLRIFKIIQSTQRDSMYYENNQSFFVLPLSNEADCILQQF